MSEDEMSGEDGLSGAEIAASVIGGLACLGLAVVGVKCLKWCLLPTPTPNTHDLEAPETPEEAAGPPQNPLKKTIKALLEPVLRTKAKVQEEAMVDPVDSVDQVDPLDPVDPVDPMDQVDQVDPTDTISQVSTASYKSIVD